MKQRIIPLLLLLLVFLPIRAQAEEDGPAAMILYEPRTKTVLEALNPDEPMLIASTTKIMTAMVVLENCTLRESVAVTKAHTDVEGSSALLQAGETYTVEELLYGLMLASGNDAALALAEHTAGSVEGFAALMNAKAEALGLENTHFANPHGLNASDHFSTARDLALMTAAAMENPAFCRIFAAQTYSTHGVEYRNHNKLLESCPGCIGGKTGYTRAAGRTLVSCAERDGFRLICVTLSDPDDWEDHRRSYDNAFAAFEFLPFPADGWKRIPVISGTAFDVQLSCDASGILVHRGAHVAQIVELPRFLFAPIAAGEAVGTVSVSENGHELCLESIRVSSAVARDEEETLPPWRRYRRNIERQFAGSFHSEDILA